MPHGFFTVEEWKSPKRGVKSQWVIVAHLDADRSLSEAIESIDRRGKPGFFRVIQTQRMVWAEKENGRLKLRRWHCGKPESLTRNTDAYTRDGGHWDVEGARSLRLAAKRAMEAKAAKQRS